MKNYTHATQLDNEICTTKCHTESNEAFGECLFRVLLVLYVRETLCDMHIMNDMRNIVKSGCPKTLSQTLTSED